MSKLRTTPQQVGIFARITQNIQWSKPNRKSLFKKSAPYVNIPDLDQDPFESSSEVTAVAYPQRPTIKTFYALRARVSRLARPMLCRLKFPRRKPPKNVAVGQEGPTAPPPICSTPAFTRSCSSITPTPASTAFTETLPDPVDRIEQDRAIRAEQDAAYKLSAERDMERISAIIAANKLAAEVEARAKERAEQAKLQREKEEAHRQAQIAWRRWARRSLVPATPENGGIKIAIRLPCGRRHVTRLPASASLEALYTLVETLLVPSEYTVEDDPEEAPEGYVHQSSFALVTTNSRVMLPNKCEVQVGSLDILRGGALVIVEQLAMDRALERIEYESDEED